MILQRNLTTYRNDIALPAWVRTNLENATGKGIRVGVIDSGWDYSLDLPWQINEGKDLLDQRIDARGYPHHFPQDLNGHGTACIGLIKEVALDASIYPIRVFDEELETSVGQLIQGINWAVDNNMQVINLSLGTLLEEALIPLYIACERARKEGSIIVAACHNKEQWSYPSIFDNAIGVTSGSFKNPFSYFYRNEHAVECVSGGAREVLWLDGAIMHVPGSSSFAAPQITAIVALLLERYPNTSFEGIKDLLATYALNK